MFTSLCMNTYIVFYNMPKYICYSDIHPVVRNADPYSHKLYDTPDPGTYEERLKKRILHEYFSVVEKGADPFRIPLHKIPVMVTRNDDVVNELSAPVDDEEHLLSKKTRFNGPFLCAQRIRAKMDKIPIPKKLIDYSKRKYMRIKSRGYFAPEEMTQPAVTMVVDNAQLGLTSDLGMEGKKISSPGRSRMQEILAELDKKSGYDRDLKVKPKCEPELIQDNMHKMMNLCRTLLDQNKNVDQIYWCHCLSKRVLIKTSKLVKGNREWFHWLAVSERFCDPKKHSCELKKGHDCITLALDNIWKKNKSLKIASKDS